MSDVTDRAYDLVRTLDHPIPENRKRAAQEIIALGPGVEPVLIRALNRVPDIKVRRRVLIILTKMEIPKAIPGLMDYITAKDRGPGDDTRALAMRAILRSQKPKHRKHLFDFYVGLRRDDDLIVRQLALEGLAKLGDPRALPFLEEAAGSDPEPMVRDTANSFMNTFVSVELSADDAAPDDEKARELYSRDELVTKLASREALQRQLGIRELLRRFPEDAFDLFVDALRSGHALARQSGIEGLGQVDDPRAFKILHNIVDNANTSRDDRALALRAMARAQMPEDINEEALLRNLERHTRNDDDVFSISAALAVISRLQHPDAIDLVQSRLAHDDTWIRETAAQAIAAGAHPGQKKLLPALKKALEDSGVRAQKVRAATGEWPANEFALQRSVLVGLSRIAEPDSPPELMVLSTVIKFLAHPNREVAEAAYDFTRLVAHQPGDLDDEGLRELLSLLGSRKRETRLDALTLLDRVMPERYRRAAPRLVSLVFENDTELTLKLIPLLARTRDREAEQALGRLTRDRNHDIAEAARTALLDAGGGSYH